MTNRLILPDKVQYLIQTLQTHGYDGYAVGGCVRDAVLGRTPHDWDITTSAKPPEIKALFAHTVDTGIAHGTVTVLLDREAFEVTTYRIDGEYEDSRHPKEVVFTASLEEDLKRRDFTMNAMAYNDRTGLVDLFEGEKDLRSGVIRCVGEARERFGEDALRMLRAVRFAAQLGFSVEDKTRQAIADMASNLSKISAERVCSELEKLVTSPNPSYLRLAWELGITEIVLPEFDAAMNQQQNNEHHFLNVGDHTLATMEAIEPERILRFAMLLHDLGKPTCAWLDEKGIIHFTGHAAVSGKMADVILRRLKFDNHSRERIVTLIKNHSLYPPSSDEGVRLAVHQVGPDCFEDFLKVKRADIFGHSQSVRERKLTWLDDIERRYHNILERGDCLCLKDLCISGRDLMEAGMEKGPKIGQVLNEMLMDVLRDPDHNNREYLLEKAFALPAEEGGKQP